MTREVLVTGAAGRLGGALVEALQARGHSVRCLVHRRPTPAGAASVRGDLLDPASLAAAVSGVDAVVHAAAVTHARSAREYASVNADGTRNLLGAAAAAGVRRFVQVSTRAIARSGGAYSRSKADAEEAVRASGLPHVIVRLPDVYGGGGEGVDELLARARAGRPVFVVGDGGQEICPIARAEAIAALVAAVERDAAQGTYTLAGRCTTVRELVQEAVAASGSSSRVISIPVGVVRVLGVLSRVFPLPLYPDQLARLLSPKPPPSPEAEADLGFRPERSAILPEPDVAA